MKILVTGGAGFIGSHVVEGLLARGHEVLIVDDLSSGKQEYIHADAQFIELDIRDERMCTVMQDFKPEAVYHLAAQKNVRISLEDPVYDAQINIIGALNVIESARKADVGHIVFVSTGGVYDETSQQPYTEQTPALPSSPYLLSKLTIDQYLVYYQQVHGMSAASVRLTNTYGPRQDPKGEAGVIAVFFDLLSRGKQVTIFGDGEQTRDFMYVGDAVEALLGVLEKKVTGIINIATARAVTVNQLYDIQKDIVGVDMQSLHGDAIAGEVRHHVMDSVRAQDELGWQARVPLEQGLEKTWEWLSSNKQV